MGSWRSPFADGGAAYASAMRIRPALLVLLIVTALASLGLVDGVTFTPRSTPSAGAAWTEASTWRTTGHTKITVAGATLRDKPVDRLSHYIAAVQVAAVADEELTDLTIAFQEQVARDGEKADELGLDGIAVQILGLPGDRSFARADGSRLKRKQKKWLDQQFGGSADDDGVDPLTFLLKDEPMTVGATWDMDLEAIGEYFDPSRFRFDVAASKATATLVDVRDWHGVQAGHFTFDVLLVPNWIKDGEIRNAKMHIVGTADLPVDGSQPWQAFDVQTELVFDGWVKRKGVKADVDLTMQFSGKESHLPPS